MADILSIKRNFCDMVLDAHPWSLAQFVMWLDIRVSEYKVNGYMVLDDENTTKPRWLTDIGLTETEVDDSTTLYPVAISTPQTHKEHVISQQKHEVLFDSPDNVIQLITNPDSDDDIASLHRVQSTETSTIEQNNSGGPDSVADMPILRKENGDKTVVEAMKDHLSLNQNSTVVETSDIQLPILIKIEDSGSNSASTLPVSSSETPSANTVTHKFAKFRRDDRLDATRKKRSFSLHDDEKPMRYLKKHVPIYQVKCRRYNNYTEQQRQRILELSMQMGPSSAARKLSTEFRVPVNESTVRSMRSRHIRTKQKHNTRKRSQTRTNDHLYLPIRK